MDLPPRSWTSTLVCRPSAPTSPRSRSGLGSGCARRGRTGFALTEKGAIIYREAKRLFATLDEFGVMAATVRGRLTGTLRLGFVDCTVTNPNSPISRAIGQFNNRDHEVTSEVSVGPPAELQRGVLDGSLILRWPAFLPRSPNWSPSRFMAKSIEFYCGAGHRLFDRKAISLDDLAGCRIVARSYWRGVDLSRMGVEQPAAWSTSWKPGQPLFCRARIWAICRSIMPRPGSLRASCAASFPKN